LEKRREIKVLIKMLKVIKENQLKNPIDPELFYPDYSIKPDPGYIILYHNTQTKNIDSIIKNGLVYDKGVTQGRGLDGDYVWCTNEPNQKGYGGNTIAFKVLKSNITDKNFHYTDIEKFRGNNTDYFLPFSIPPENILFIDRYITITDLGTFQYRLSDIPRLISKYGTDKVFEVLSKNIYKNISIEELRELIYNS